MNLLHWFRGLDYPDVERRIHERRTGCASLTPTKEEAEIERLELEEMRRRLRHVQRELDIIRREPPP